MRPLRYAAIACFALFVIVTLVLAAARSDVSIIDNQISDLLEGRFARLAGATFLVLATGAAALAYLQFRDGFRPLAFALWTYGAATALAGLTPPHALVHDIAALTAFLAVPVAVGVTPFIRPLVRALLIALVLGTFATWPLGVGLGERITVYGEIALMSWLALRTRGRRSR